MQCKMPQSCSREVKNIVAWLAGGKAKVILSGMAFDHTQTPSTWHKACHTMPYAKTATCTYERRVLPHVYG